MNKTLIAISTYKKNGALQELLTSLIDNDYPTTCDILICDDGSGEARELVKDYSPILYIESKNPGSIARNKNRGIKYFLENTQYEYLILLDDDLLVRSPGLVEALIETEYPHITGYLGKYTEGVGIEADERKQFSGNAFFDDFKPKGKTDKGVMFCPGAQGIMLFLTREIAEKAKYFHVPPGRYGYEHSIYSNVINKILGYQIDHFPIFIRTPVYLIGNYNYPNVYEAKPEENVKWWSKKKLDILLGIDYINNKPGVPEDEILERF